MTPETQARQRIDARLQAAGWLIQDMKQLNLGAGPGIAVREHPTDTGPADYVLFVHRQPVGVIEAKKDSAGENLTATEAQTERYASSGGGSSARSAGGSGGGVSSSSGAGLGWDGREWKLGSQWDSLSQSWKNLTGSNTADTTGALGLGSTSSGSEPGCWVWVDEDWQPSPEMVTIGGASKPVTVDGVVQMTPMVPIRSTPFNRIMGDGGGGASKDDYAPGIRVSLDYATLCMGSGSGLVDAEALRLGNELYLGEGGRYAFNNNSVLEKKPIQMLVAPAGAPGTGQINVTPQPNAKGYRKTHKNGDWVSYNIDAASTAKRRLAAPFGTAGEHDRVKNPQSSRAALAMSAKSLNTPSTPRL